MVHAIGVLTGRPARDSEISGFETYLETLLEWNRTHRITGFRSADAIVRELFLDALLFLSRLPEGRLIVADIGSGPGIPGVPLRLVRENLELTLIEATRKKVSFLASLKRAVRLDDVVVLEGRAEDLLVREPSLPGKFDVVVARAVGGELFPIAMKYLKPGGLLLVGGGPDSAEDELTQATAGIRREVVAFPSMDRTRTFLVARRDT